MHATTIAACAGFDGSSDRMNSGWPIVFGQSIPSARAVRRNRRTAYSGAGGSVRRMPTLPLTMIDAAAKPVSSESCAFHDSTGSISRNSSRAPSSATSTSWAGIGSDTPAALGLLGDPQLTDRPQQGQRGSRRSLARSAAARPRSRAWPATAPAPAPPARRSRLRRRRARSSTRTRAGPRRAASDAAPSLRTFGCSGTLLLAPYNDSPRACDSTSTGSPGCDERHHVRDRVVHDVAVTVGRQVHRLVEVHRARRVDGDELQVGQVQVGQLRVARVLLRRRLHRASGSQGRRAAPAGWR